MYFITVLYKYFLSSGIETDLKDKFCSRFANFEVFFKELSWVEPEISSSSNFSFGSIKIKRPAPTPQHWFH